MEWIYTLLRLLSTHRSSPSLITLTKVDIYTLRGKLRRMNWYPVEFIEDRTLVSAFLDFSAGIIVMSHPQLPRGPLCWVPSLPASPVPAKWTSTTIRPEPEAQFDLHSESMTWQCTYLKPCLAGSWESRTCSERKVDRDGWSCHAPLPQRLPILQDSETHTGWPLEPGYPGQGEESM